MTEHHSDVVDTEAPAAPDAAAKPSPRAAALKRLAARAENFEKGDLGSYGERLAGLSSGLEEVTASLESMRALVAKGEAMEAKLAENGQLLDQIIGIGGKIFDAAESFDAEAVAVLQADMTELKANLHRLAQQGGGGADPQLREEMAELARSVALLRTEVEGLRAAKPERSGADEEDAGGVDTLEADVREAVMAGVRRELPALIDAAVARAVDAPRAVDRQTLETLLFDIDPDVFSFLDPARDPERDGSGDRPVPTVGADDHPARVAAREAAERRLATSEDG